MRSLSRIKDTRGVTLIAAVAIMLILAVLSGTLVMLLGVTSRGVVHYASSSQALALVQAGLNWYMMQLADTADWDNAAGQTGISLNPGTFDVVVSNKASPQTDSTTSTRMDITVTGKVTAAEGVTIQRIMSQRAWKLPSASKFAIFWIRTVRTLSLTNVAINGDMWSIGNTSASGSSITNGVVYHPTGTTITGLAQKTISSPNPAMPTFNAAYYTNLISGYDTAISTSPSASPLNITGTYTLSGTVRCRELTTSGNCTITGNGILIANGTGPQASRGAMTLGTSGSVVNIQPSAGGTIIFLARRNFTVGNVMITNPDTSVRVRMYSRCDGTSDLLQLQTGANINRALILSNRRISAQGGAIVINSTLFVNDPGSASNNNLTVTGSGTIVGTAASPCSLISIGRGGPSLQITTTASVTGLVYQWDVNNSGTTNIAGTNSANRVNITGCLISNQFVRSGSNDVISNANITYDPTAIPDPPPEGFDSFVTKKPDSWSGS